MFSFHPVKQEILKVFQADYFFDDQEINVKEASNATASGHVPYGVKNNKG